MRRAQGISVNTIIITAIALIVLVVLIAIFSGKMGIFSKEISDQTAGKADCVLDLYGDWITPSQCQEEGGYAYPNPLMDAEAMSQGGTLVCCVWED